VGLYRHYNRSGYWAEGVDEQLTTAKA